MLKSKFTLLLPQPVPVFLRVADTEPSAYLFGMTIGKLDKSGRLIDPALAEHLKVGRIVPEHLTKKHFRDTNLATLTVQSLQLIQKVVHQLPREAVSKGNKTAAVLKLEQIIQEKQGRERRVTAFPTETVRIAVTQTI